MYEAILSISLHTWLMILQFIASILALIGTYLISVPLIKSIKTIELLSELEPSDSQAMEDMKKWLVEKYRLNEKLTSSEASMVSIGFRTLIFSLLIHMCINFFLVKGSISLV